jgi:hypothetical protein
MQTRIPLCSVVALLCLFIVGLFAAPALYADTVVLKNGDRLTGTAVKLDGGKLTFKTAYADPIAIAWDQVTNLTLSAIYILPMPKENLAVTSVVRTDAGLVVTTPTGSVTLEPVAVTVLRSAADEKTYEASLHPNWATHGQGPQLQAWRWREATLTRRPLARE